MSLHQYFRLLLDYRDIWIYPNEQTMACALMPTNYFVVVLPSQASCQAVHGLMLPLTNACYTCQTIEYLEVVFVLFRASGLANMQGPGEGGDVLHSLSIKKMFNFRNLLQQFCNLHCSMSTVCKCCFTRNINSKIARIMNDTVCVCFVYCFVQTSVRCATWPWQT